MSREVRSRILATAVLEPFWGTVDVSSPIVIDRGRHGRDNGGRHSPDGSPEIRRKPKISSRRGRDKWGNYRGNIHRRNRQECCDFAVSLPRCGRDKPGQ
jgi:hypothetical protein